MLTCRNGLGIYVSCHGKRLTAYRSVLLHNDSLWISSYYFSYSVITYRRDKVTPLRKENTFVILLRNSRFRRIWFSRFLRTTTCRTVWSHPCRDDSVSYATHRFIIAVDNKKQTSTKLHIPLYVRCTYRRYACHFKGNIHLLFGAASHLSTNILMLCGVTCWVIYTNGGARFQSWSPLRYTTLTCLFGSISLIVIVTLFTYTNVITVPSLRTIMNVRFELLYMSIIAGVIAVFCWNAGNRYISSINGILFMNLVPVLALIGSIFRGYTVVKIEVAGASLTIIALLCNNVWQRKESTKSPPQFVRWGFLTYEQLLAILGTYSLYIMFVPSIVQFLSCTFL